MTYASGSFHTFSHYKLCYWRYCVHGKPIFNRTCLIHVVKALAKISYVLMRMVTRLCLVIDLGYLLVRMNLILPLLVSSSKYCFWWLLGKLVVSRDCFWWLLGKLAVRPDPWNPKWTYKMWMENHLSRVISHLSFVAKQHLIHLMRGVGYTSFCLHLFGGQINVGMCGSCLMLFNHPLHLKNKFIVRLFISTYCVIWPIVDFIVVICSKVCLKVHAFKNSLDKVSSFLSQWKWAHIYSPSISSNHWALWPPPCRDFL